MHRFLTALFFTIAFILPAAAEADRTAIREACHDDFKALCSDEHGHGRGRACLQEHLDEVSPACKAALEAK